MVGFGVFEVTQFEDLRQSNEWAKYIRKIGWRVEETRKQENKKTKIFIRKLPLIGSVVKIQRPVVVPPIEELDRVARKHRALFVKLEPSVETGHAPSLQKIGKHFEEDTWTLLPTRTIHIDLSPSRKDILANFSKDARYSIRRARRNGVSVHPETSSEILRSAQDDGLRTFYKLLKETGGRKKFYVAPFTHLKAKVEAFQSKSALILAHHDGKPIAGALILFHGSVAYYHHAAASPKGRELLAAYPIVWEAIKLAKERGCHTFDLEGIYDQRYKVCRRLKSLSVFKRKFGGEEVTFPGSFVRYYNPLLKLAFKISSVFS